MYKKANIKTLVGFVAVILTIFISTAVQAASKVEIDAKVNACLKKFYSQVSEARELGNMSKGILVFPSVIKAGFLVGAEYGEGALRMNGKTVDYYSTAAGSFGLQIGAQSKAIIIMFMKDKALADFRNANGWKVGLDGSIAIVQVGAGGSVDSDNVKDPVIGFFFGQKGLMVNLTLEGAKITKLDK